MALKTRPMESFTEKQQADIKNAHDIQLDRAEDLLKGILIYTHHTQPQKLTRKTEKAG